MGVKRCYAEWERVNVGVKWSGGVKAENGVGFIAANQLMEKEAEVERTNEKTMKVKVVIWDDVWEVVSCCYSQVERSKGGIL